MMRTQTANIQYDLLESIQNEVKVPLVIHGSTGLPDSQLVKMRGYHVCKVNIGTALRVAFDKGLRAELEERPNDYIYIDLLEAAVGGRKTSGQEKMELLGFLICIYGIRHSGYPGTALQELMQRCTGSRIFIMKGVYDNGVKRQAGPPERDCQD
ncbi:MAG: class II fructose-bisphosphate aldolase [Enterocloster bolteae]